MASSYKMGLRASMNSLNKFLFAVTIYPTFKQTHVNAFERLITKPIILPPSVLSSSHASAQKCCPFHHTLSSVANASSSSFSVLAAVLSQFQLSSPLSISAALWTISQLCCDSSSTYLATQLRLTSIGHLKPRVTGTELSLFSSGFRPWEGPSH